MAELIAALRDVTFYARPSGFGPNPRLPKYHALVERPEIGYGPACGILSHADGTEVSASHLQDFQKCGRPGCRAAFNAEQQTNGS